MVARITTRVVAGRTAGTTIDQKVRTRPAPSMAADS